MSSQALINQVRIRKLWRDVREYDDIIQKAKKHGHPEIALKAVNAKLSALTQIQELYENPG